MFPSLEDLQIIESGAILVITDTIAMYPKLRKIGIHDSLIGPSLLMNINLIASNVSSLQWHVFGQKYYNSLCSSRKVKPENGYSFLHNMNPWIYIGKFELGSFHLTCDSSLSDKDKVCYGIKIRPYIRTFIIPDVENNSTMICKDSDERIYDYDGVLIECDSVKQIIINDKLKFFKTEDNLAIEIVNELDDTSDFFDFV